MAKRFVISSILVLCAGLVMGLVEIGSSEPGVALAGQWSYRYMPAPIPRSTPKPRPLPKPLPKPPTKYPVPTPPPPPKQVNCNACHGNGRTGTLPRGHARI